MKWTTRSSQLCHFPPRPDTSVNSKTGLKRKVQYTFLTNITERACPLAICILKLIAGWIQTKYILLALHPPGKLQCRLSCSKPSPDKDISWNWRHLCFKTFLKASVLIPTEDFCHQTFHISQRQNLRVFFMTNKKKANPKTKSLSS